MHKELPPAGSNTDAVDLYVILSETVSFFRRI